MTTTPELVAMIQQDRERHIEQDRLACLATCANADCCKPSLADRLARFMRPATYPVMGNRS